MKIKSKILIIAGSDSSGGAGLQADIKSDSVKIGMLHSKKVIDLILKSIKKLNLKKIVLDPVMVAKGGTKLIDNKAIFVLKKKLMKKVDLITPNIPEAEILTKIKINSVLDMKNAAKILLDLGAKNVLIKGGHLSSKTLKDIFVNKKETAIFTNKKIKTKNTHGTGCTLSTAIATYYGCGKTLKKSCELGIRYVKNAIKTRPNFGKGNGPINHLNSFIIEKKFR